MRLATAARTEERAVSLLLKLLRGRRAFLVGDLPFGTYEASAEQAVHSGIRLLKEGRMDAIKLEGTPEHSGKSL